MNTIPDAGKIAASFCIVKIHPDAHRPAHHVFFGHETPFATVIAAVTVVTHHKKMAFRHDPLAIAAAGSLMQQDIVFNITNRFMETNSVSPRRGTFHFFTGVTTVFLF